MDVYFVPDLSGIVFSFSAVSIFIIYLYHIEKVVLFNHERMLNLVRYFFLYLNDHVFFSILLSSLLFLIFIC